jgi:hypothetical protein
VKDDELERAARKFLNANEPAFLHRADIIIALRDFARQALARQRDEVEGLRAIIRGEQTQPPFDVTDDQTTELAVKLAEAQNEIARLRHALVEATAGRLEALEKANEAIKQLMAAFDLYVNWNGAAHEAGCPEDDTCECAGHEINEAVSAAYRRGYEARDVVARVVQAEAERVLGRDKGELVR